MKKVIQKTGKLLFILLCIVVAFLSLTTIYHHISLGREADSIVPNGILIDVNGYQTHVYAQGEKGNKPTLVFMSGSATVAPVYDFKSLYDVLSHEYRIAVVEKAGYGYSEIYEEERDIDTLLSEVRQSLSLAGESGPYVLFPHSMSGLEAVYWAQQYPKEITAIIGLDMAVPESYEYFDFVAGNQMMSTGRAAVWLGLHRIPGFYALDTASLTEQEIRQQKLLMYRNAVNIDYVLEGKAVYSNAMEVKSGEILSLPILMFVSDGQDFGEYWLPCQMKFAAQHGAQMIRLNCGHYVHHTQFEYIAEESLKFFSALQ